MKYLLSLVLSYFAVIVFGVGGWLVSLLLPGSDRIVIGGAVLAGIALVSVTLFATDGDVWSLVARTDRPPPRHGLEADYAEPPE